MGSADRRAGVFFDRASRWRDEMLALRAIVLASPLDEAFKWRQPVYVWQGGNVAIIHNFRDGAALGFFQGVLLADPEGILVTPGAHSRSSRLLKVTSVAEVEARADVLRAYVQEALENAKAGRKVDLPPDDLQLPEELVERLAGDADFRAAWEALTPGRRRGYVVHFSQAKQSKTRAARIDRQTARILQGKGMHDR